jgi:hypothetical protein
LRAPFIIVDGAEDEIDESAALNIKVERALCA